MKTRLGNAGVWAGIAVFAFAAVVFWKSLSLKYSSQYGPGPGMFPIWLSGILMLISLVYIWQSVKKAPVTFAEIIPQGRALGNILSVIGSLILFMLIVDFTGFVVAGTVLLFIVLGREFKWHLALGIGFGSSLIVFVVFRYVFDIPLPVNVLGW
jgi:putative tricarboxylic transport membrane protein